jgi:hypothetical protein
MSGGKDEGSTEAPPSSALRLRPQPRLAWTPDYRIKSDAAPRPCLLAAVTNPAGEIVGLHSIELNFRTGAKSQRTPKPKLSRGPIGEGSVFLGNLQELAATLVIGEGLETTLTRSLVGPCNAHACLGALRFIERRPHHTRVEILADTDKRDAARRLARRYADSAAAYVVTVPDSLGPKADINDALCSLGAAAVQMAIEDAERFTNETAQSALSHFDLKIGSDIEIPRRIVERLEELYGPVIVSEGRVWRFNRTHWAALEDDHLARFVHRADGAQYLDANNELKVVRLNKSRVASILDAAMKYHPDAASGEIPELPILEKNRSDGSTGEVSFWTSRDVREVVNSHVNFAVADTKQWEQSATYMIDTNPAIDAFVKNAGLGFAIPYFHNGQPHDYEPDFIIRLKGGEGWHLILETKGYDTLAEVKEQAAKRWIAAVNADGRHGK